MLYCVCFKTLFYYDKLHKVNESTHVMMFQRVEDVGDSYACFDGGGCFMRIAKSQVYYIIQE